MVHRKRIYLAILLGFAVGAFIYFINIGEAFRLENYILDGQTYDRIVSEREKCDGELLRKIMFEEEPLFYDRMSHTFYYSVDKKNKQGYNPVVTLNKSKGVEFSLREERITDELIQSGRRIECMVYDDTRYEPYTLAVTTLPIMSIETEGNIFDNDVRMEMTLFDNRAETGIRRWESEGIIARRGRTTKDYEKVGYKVSLNDKLPLMGMRRDDDWVLYAGYNDQEKIRNVFSCNLWKNSCAANNAFGIDNGVEYRYLELLINGNYEGLYALGYRIDDKQMGINPAADSGCVYKKVDYYSEYPVTRSEDGSIPDYEISSNLMNSGQEAEKWQMLYDFYEGIWQYRDNDDWLMESIDIDNSIDMHLFINLVQGEDNAKGPLTKNMYITAVRTEQGGYRFLYTPWDLDITWGNVWLHKAKNYTLPYLFTPDNHVLWESGSLYELLCNGNEEIWERFLNRYWELRAGPWSDRTILEQLDQYEEQIFDSGAYVREQERWPNGSYVRTEKRLSSFKQYVLERLASMDSYYETLPDAFEGRQDHMDGGER